MSIWGKIAGAAAGLAVGGPIGALIGAVAGHMVDRSFEGDDTASAAEREVCFTMGVIALGAKMAKADGVVTRVEIEAFKDVFKIPPGEMASVARVFDLAKQDVAGFESYAKQLHGLFARDNPQLLRDVLEGLFHIAKADDMIHPAEEDYLSAVAGYFGISETEFRYIRARHVLDPKRNPYDVLEISPKVNDDELKRHYRRLVVENHPDKLIARGVPSEFVEIANQKLAAINEAYDEIRKERGL